MLNGLNVGYSEMFEVEDENVRLFESVTFIV